jgi:hypothetical protein
MDAPYDDDDDDDDAEVEVVGQSSITSDAPV